MRKFQNEICVACTSIRGAKFMSGNIPEDKKIILSITMVNFVNHIPDMLQKI